MAQEVTVDGKPAKIRHPLGPLGLGIVTLGIYPLVWYFKINRELRDQGEDVSPGVALLAITLGVILLLIPPLVSMYNTAERVRRVQERKGVESPISPVLALVLLFLPVVNMFQTAYVQSSLNRAWERATRDDKTVARSPEPTRSPEAPVADG